MDSNDPAQSIEIDQLGYIAELESRTETSQGNAGATNGIIASGTSQKSVSFTNTFLQVNLEQVFQQTLHYLALELQ